MQSKSALKAEKMHLSDVSDKYCSLSELCRELSISTATGKNWLKLDKIRPSVLHNNSPMFASKYIGILKKEIMNGKNLSLKSRRNKKYVSGNNVYSSYISSNSINLPVIHSIIDYIRSEEITITDEFLSVLLADCAVRLILSKSGVSFLTRNEVLNYICSNDYTLKNQFLYLAHELIIADLDFVRSVFQKYPDLFNHQYIFEPGEDILGLLYISLKNIGSRKAQGAYYTPTKIVKKLCNRLLGLNTFDNKTILDPCCGTGNFLLQLPDGIGYECVYGNDIDIVSVNIARINYALKYNISDKGIIYSHIRQSDYLASNQGSIKYDFIIGNPPWGYDFSGQEKAFLKDKYLSAVGSNIESYDIFVEESLNNLTNEGVLSFILPEAFLNVKTHSPIREFLLQKTKFQFIEYLGNAFDKVQCPSIILQVKKKDAAFNNSNTIVNDGNREFIIRADRKFNANCLSFLTTDEEYSVLHKIENIENKITLENNADFALGIVTGNNKDYISSVKTPENELVLKGSDIYKYKFVPSDNYLAFKPELFQQVAPVEYYRAEEKLFYRFICNQLVFAYDNSQTLSLNSCNILIPRIENLSIKYIMAVLNSRIAQFYFKNKFNSLKVLRSHIEQIPIPLPSEIAQQNIVSTVDLILDCNAWEEYLNLYNLLESQIVKLYNLSSVEADLVANYCTSKQYLLI